MNRVKLPISSIQVENRLRFDQGDVEELALSIKQYGLIQPVVVNQNNRLVAGGRRVAACTLLGHTEIDVVYKETLSDDYLHELEVEENVKRKDMTWQERVFSIEIIHNIRVRRGALEGTKWGQRETGALLGMNTHCTVNYALAVAEKLHTEQLLPESNRRFWNCDSMSEAWKLILRDEEDALNAELASRDIAVVTDGETVASLDDLFGAPSASSVGSDMSQNELANLLMQRVKTNGYKSLNETEAMTLYLANSENKEEDFAAFHEKRLKMVEPWMRIDISKRLHRCDSIKFMHEHHGLFDHIITDIPYGIDMDMLQQQNTGMDVSTVREEHDVEYNTKLIQDFFPAAYVATKDNAFVITWCDAMLFKWMHDLAVDAGFRVQRWPFHWIKPHAGNQAAQYNMTKATEIAIVCRKPKATLVEAGAINYIQASNDSEVDHPFAKPQAVWQPLINAVSLEGQTILEPFAGRGSGVLALLYSKRNFVACEVNEAHFNALTETVKQYYLTINSNYTFI